MDPFVEAEITLMQAALRLARTYPATQKLMLRGRLGPARQVAGRWLVSEAGVAAYLAHQAEAAHLALETAPPQRAATTARTLPDRDDIPIALTDPGLAGCSSQPPGRTTP